MDFDSEHKYDAGVLNSEVVSESDGNTAVLTVEMCTFLSGFLCPAQTLLLLDPVLLGPGEATHSELLGTKRVNTTFSFICNFLAGANKMPVMTMSVATQLGHALCI